MIQHTYMPFIAKRCKHDLRGVCPFGDSCSYIHAACPGFIAPPYIPVASHPYDNHPAISPVLQDALLHPMSPHMLGTAQRPFEEPGSAVAFTSYPPPSLPADIDEAFRALRPSNPPQRQRRSASSAGRTCHYRSPFTHHL